MGQSLMSAESRAGRRRHYASFYGDEPLPEGSGVVIGNCQAESLRICLDSPDAPFVRIPPIHEITQDELPLLHRVIAVSRVIVSQPVRNDFHGLPLGTAQLLVHAAPGARRVIVPAVRHRSMQPSHVVVRFHEGQELDPPIVPYHDLRTMAMALGARPTVLTPALVRAIAAASTAELRRRELRADAVPISDLFARPHFELLRTINHPGNPIWIELARRVRERLGLEQQDGDPGRPLLASIVAPREHAVIEAWDLDDLETTDWTLGERRIPQVDIERAHLDWYARNPELLQIAARRHEAALAEFTAEAVHR